MKVALDTNILLRLLLADDLDQQEAALSTVKQAELVVIPIHALCELVWVLTHRYGKSGAEVAGAIRALLTMPNTLADEPAISAGLALLEAGGDFADGAIAFGGRKLGAQIFLTFDRDAAEFVKRAGHDARTLPL